MILLTENILMSIILFLVICSNHLYDSTAKRVNQIFTPYVRLMELDQKIETSVKSNPNLFAYQRIKELLSTYIHDIVNNKTQFLI